MTSSDPNSNYGQQAVDLLDLLQRLVHQEQRPYAAYQLILEHFLIELGLDGEDALLLQPDRGTRSSWDVKAHVGITDFQTYEHHATFLDVAAEALDHGFAIRNIKDGWIVGLKVTRHASGNSFVTVVNSPEDPHGTRDEWERVGWPLGWLARSVEQRSTQNVSSAERAQLGVALDVLLLLNDQSKFISAGMLVCNELATHYKSLRVTLGWASGEHIRLRAASNTNKLEKRLDAVLILEAAMQECFDQDTEIVIPRAEDEDAIVREHEAFALSQKTPYVVSLPIRLDAEVKGILTLQRSDTPFSEAELIGLRLICDLVARRLDDLHKRNLSLPEKAKAFADDLKAKIVGHEYSWQKFWAIFGAVTLLFLCCCPWPYKVEGQFTLKAETLVHLPAPFDGYIQEVPCRVGDEVRKDQVLLRLDPTELQLQATESMANMRRYEGEAQMAQDSGTMNQMHIAMAQADQNKSKLLQTQYQLERAAIISPFDGVLVEGALKERIGSPVKKGEILMKVARLDDFYAQVEVSEKDINEVKEGADAEIAFSSRPEKKFNVKVERIEPSAVAKKDGNIFLVRCQPDQSYVKWWRPGMSGLAKISAGYRPPIWILAHQLIDFIRLKLWI